MMHDLLEGCIRHNFKLMLESLRSRNLYSSAQLNEDLKQFKYGRIDSQNKVPNSLFTDNSSFKISATHTWTLLRIFPLLTGEKLKLDEFYINYMELAKIFMVLNDDEFDDNKINNLRNSIDNYLKNFKILYQVNIIPKQHFLTHYPSIIIKFGPPKLYNTMRFEAKHSYFKSVHRAVHNHINLNLHQ